MSVAMIAPLGFAMGMPFPTAMARLEGWHPPSVRWAWSLNAASSVLGSVGALVCSIYLGLVQTLIVGGLFLRFGTDPWALIGAVVTLGGFGVFLIAFESYRRSSRQDAAVPDTWR